VVEHRRPLCSIAANLAWINFDNSHLRESTMIACVQGNGLFVGNKQVRTIYLLLLEVCAVIRRFPVCVAFRAKFHRRHGPNAAVEWTTLALCRHDWPFLPNRAADVRSVHMNLLALPIQHKKIKFSFPVAALAGFVIGLSASIPFWLIGLSAFAPPALSVFIPLLVLGLSAFALVLAVLSLSSVFFVFWAGTIGIPFLAIFILIELCKKQFAQAAYTSVILILDMIPVFAYFALTPVGQFLSKQ
jgi:hypothetical protein